jgi:hypothetical protein
MTARRAPLAGLIVGLSLGVSANPAGRIHEVAVQLPGALSDDEFWQLSQQLSEPNGFFRSDNLVSDETIYREVVPTLADNGRRHGVYLGVGPEQNFTYIAALDPQIAFIVDIRRGNLQLQLMYKALFEMSADRAEFVSKLFTKPRPPGLSTNSSGTEIINAYWTVPTSSDVYKANVQAIRDLLTKKRNLPLSPEDLAGIEYVYYNFYWHGPAITWASSQGRKPGLPTFGDLIKQTDASGHELSFSRMRLRSRLSRTCR